MLVPPSVSLPWGVASHAVEFTNYYNQYPFPLKSFTICLMSYYSPLNNHSLLNIVQC